MWNAEYISYKGNTNFIRAYQGTELVWGKFDYSDAFWIENINDYPILFSVREYGLIRDKNGEYSGDVLFSFDKENWEGVNSYSYQGHVTIPPHTKMYLINDTDIDFETYNGYFNNLFKIYTPDSYWGNSDTEKYNIGGNLNKLVYNWKKNVINVKNTHAFYCLFLNSFVVDASELVLPSLITTSECYKEMFGGCRYLKYPPATLPAKVVNNSSYKRMFEGCSNLLKTTDMLAETVGSEGCYYMYFNCFALKEVSEIRVKRIDYYGMHRMFYNCQSIKYPPELPATIINGQGAYYDLFAGCVNLLVAPKLNHITHYSSEAFRGMFSSCKKLEYAPELPIHDSVYLPSMCFASMFRDCTNIKECPALPIGNYICQHGVFYFMFYGCTSITAPCEFPTGYTIGDNPNIMFQSMYEGCSNLQTAPDLSWVNIAGDKTFAYMFKNCTSLATPPKMPNIQFDSTDINVCQEMFRNCTSLTESPILYSSFIPNNGYRSMFNGCINLNKITCLATDKGDVYSTMAWMTNVSPTGTLYKHPDMNNWRDATWYFPSDWEIIDYTE